MSTAIAVQPIEGRTMIEFTPSPSIFEDFEALTNSIAQRAFGFFKERGYSNGQDLDDWLRAESELLTPVQLELSESEDGYTVRAEVTGFGAKDLKVRAESNSVYICGKTGQKKEEKKGRATQYSEVSASQFYRRIDLADSINPEKAVAHLENGVLELSLPKVAQSKPIEVKAA